MMMMMTMQMISKIKTTLMKELIKTVSTVIIVIAIGRKEKE